MFVLAVEVYNVATEEDAQDADCERLAVEDEDEAEDEADFAPTKANCELASYSAISCFLLPWQHSNV